MFTACKQSEKVFLRIQEERVSGELVRKKNAQYSVLLSAGAENATNKGDDVRWRIDAITTKDEKGKAKGESELVT